MMFDQWPQVESELMIFQDDPVGVIRQCWLKGVSFEQSDEDESDDVTAAVSSVACAREEALHTANRFMRHVAASRAWTAKTGGMFPMLCKTSDEDTIHELSCSRGGGKCDTSVAFNAYTLTAENLFERINCPECMNGIKISFWIASQFHGLGGAPDYVMSYHRLETLREQINKFTPSVAYQEAFWYPMLDHSEQHREMIEEEMSGLHRSHDSKMFDMDRMMTLLNLETSVAGKVEPKKKAKKGEKEKTEGQSAQKKNTKPCSIQSWNQRGQSEKSRTETPPIA